MIARFMNTSLTNKYVFLRADLNVPLDNQQLLNDYRLQALKPTLAALRKQGAYIILGTHIGRPKTGEMPLYNGALSTKLLMPWFEQEGYHVIHSRVESASEKKVLLEPGSILLLENLRFYPGEKTSHTDIADAFAQQLAGLADYYINDAFALLHRTDTSITQVPALFALEQKSIGLLIAKELGFLTPVRETPDKPYTVILGGGKAADKLSLAADFTHKATTLALCPTLSTACMQTLGNPVGKSFFELEVLEKAKLLLEKARQHNVQVLLPVDYQIAHQTLEGRLEYCASNMVPDDAYIINVGPKTSELYAQAIEQSATIFFNGAMGFLSRPETMKGTNALLQSIAQSTGTSIIGGGESATAVHQLGIKNAISFCSTGGGATLAYLAGKELPALQALY